MVTIRLRAVCQTIMNITVANLKLALLASTCSFLPYISKDRSMGPQ